MLFTGFIVLVIFAIAGSLARALYYLVKGNGNHNGVAIALTWRIALSVSLFGFLFLAYCLGWIQPHGLAR
jgi:hypothetical protein